jgi:hypothetical protein
MMKRILTLIRVAASLAIVALLAYFVLVLHV